LADVGQPISIVGWVELNGTHLPIWRRKRWWVSLHPPYAAGDNTGGKRVGGMPDVGATQRVAPTGNVLFEIGAQSA
jgi:hypothetical protein